ncbi:MAG: hypothetical protein AB7N65_24090 [Vicinamibacterales bacterium]
MPSDVLLIFRDGTRKRIPQDHPEATRIVLQATTGNRTFFLTDRIDPETGLDIYQEDTIDDEAEV